MDEHQRIEAFNQSLDRVLQGRPVGRVELTAEDRRALALARRASQIDLSHESKLQTSFRRQLAEQAALQLPHASGFSLSLLFRPRRLSWAGLVLVLVLVMGLVFGNMNAQVASFASGEAMTHATPMIDPHPVPTPLAPLTSFTPAQFTTVPARTPILITSSGASGNAP